MSKLVGVWGVGFSLLSASCVTYSGVSRADGKLYISGATTYVIISVPFIKRCDVEGTVLLCEELAEPAKQGTAAGGSSAPAGGQAAPPASAAPHK